MNEELLKLIYDYSNKSKLADQNFINKVVEISSNYKQLCNYIFNVKHSSYDVNSPKSVFGYNFSTKKIIIYDEGLKQYLNNNNYFVQNNEKIFCQNIRIAQMLLHEIEHANQSKIIETQNSIESQILKLTGSGKSRDLIIMNLKNLGFGNKMIEIFMNNKIKLYYKYYEYAPQERLAEIKSHEKMIEILHPIKNFVPNTYAIENNLVKKSKLRGYKINNELISPTIYYLKKQGEDNSLKKFDFYDESNIKCLNLAKQRWNLEKRINLGLPIDINEYSSVSRL